MAFVQAAAVAQTTAVSEVRALVAAVPAGRWDWDRLAALLSESAVVTSPALAEDLQRVADVLQVWGTSLTSAKASIVRALIAARIGSRFELCNNLATYLESNRDPAGAIAMLEVAAEDDAPRAAHALGRVFDIRLATGDHRRAKDTLRRLLAGDLDDWSRVTNSVRAAELARSVGAFGDAAAAVRSARQTLAGLAASDDRHTYLVNRLGLCEIDLAIAQYDYEAVPEIVTRLGKTVPPGSRMAQRIEAVSLLVSAESSAADAAHDRLERMIERLDPSLRSEFERVLVERLLAAGQLQRADDVGVKIRARVTAEPSRSEVVALALLALHGDRASALTAAELTPWLSRLDAQWQLLMADWHSIPPEESGLDFLCFRERRSLLYLWCRARLSVGDAAAVTECFQRYLDTERAGSLARRIGLGAVRVADVVALASPGEVWLGYLPSHAGSLVFAVTSAGVTVHAGPSDSDWLGPIRRVRSVMSELDRDVDEARFASDTKALAARLLPESLRPTVAAAKTLVVCGRDLVFGARLEVLPWGSALLGLQKAIAYAPSYSLAVGLRKRGHDPARETRLLLASELAAADRTRWGHDPVNLGADQLTSALRGAAPVVVYRSARVSDFHAAARDADFVLVVAHGVFDGTLRRPAGMLLGADPDAITGALFAKDFGVVRSRAVLLGVCGAARGRFRRGDDGVNRLGAALLEAGAQTVVVPDVDLRSDDLLVVLRAVAEPLARGETLAEALRVAREAMYAQSRHPARWASFVVEGLPAVRVEWRLAVESWWAVAHWLLLPVLVVAAIGLGRLRHRVHAR